MDYSRFMYYLEIIIYDARSHPTFLKMAPRAPERPLQVIIDGLQAYATLKTV